MKKLLSTIEVISLLLIPALTFGQTYSGPATGSVNSGVVVTTDDFLFTPTVSESYEQPRVHKYMEIETEPIMYEGNKPVFDNYVYVNDKNTNSSLSG